MNIDTIENLIEDVCARIGQTYGGYHTISPGDLHGEPCPNIAFHVGQLEKPRIVDGVQHYGTGIVYHAFVGSSKTIVIDNTGKLVAEFYDLTKDSLFDAP